MKTEANGGPRPQGETRNGHGNGNGGRSTAVEFAQTMMRMRKSPEPADLLPLTEPVFHILIALADRELHGYGIILSVEEATSGKVRLRTGTLYTAVRRMADEGLIEESDDSADDDRRRYYRLTSFGRSVARAESRRVASLASLARSKGLLARGARPRY
jgi:DNA-binding PadR family transcriptional regulator